MLEAFHGHADPKAVEAAWPYLSNPDRFLRYAARVAVEFQDPATWREKALAETNPQAAARGAAGPDPGLAPPTRPTATPTAPAPDRRSQAEILARPRPARLGRRSPTPGSSTCSASSRSSSTASARPTTRWPPADRPHLDAPFPAKGRELNVELCNLLVYLKAPDRRGQDRRPARGRADPGGADRVRPGPPGPQGRLDARAAQGLFLVDRPGAPTSRAARASAGSSSRSRTTPSPTLTRLREGRAQADPRGPARRRRPPPPPTPPARERSSRPGPSTSWSRSSRPA